MNLLVKRLSLLKVNISQVHSISVYILTIKSQSNLLNQTFLAELNGVLDIIDDVMMTLMMMMTMISILMLMMMMLLIYFRFVYTDVDLQRKKHGLYVFVQQDVQHVLFGL